MSQKIREAGLTPRQSIQLTLVGLAVGLVITIFPVLVFESIRNSSWNQPAYKYTRVK